MRKKVFALLAFVLFVAFSGAANANLRTALDGMFMTNTTAAGAYNSQSRGGFVGGGFSARTPVRSINLLAFDPPRYSAGCGGIDLYGGSFSFINADQLTALFRQIASNAIGAVFKLAIAAISPPIDKIMGDFQSMVQAMNSALKSTCDLNNMTFKSEQFSKAWTDLKEDTKGLLEGKGIDVDRFTAGLKQMVPGGASDETKKSELAVPGGNPRAGNTIWKALWKTNAGSYFGTPGTAEADPMHANELILSMVGTTIYPGKVNPSPAGQDNAPLSRDAILDLEMLKSPSQITQPNGTQIKGIYFWKCKDTTDTQDGTVAAAYEEQGCLTMERTFFAFDGMDGYVQRMLFGGEPSGGAQPGSLIANIRNCNASVGTCFTPAQKAFLETISAPIMSLLRSVQGVDGGYGMEILAGQLVDYISLELMERYGKSAIVAAAMTFDGVKDIARPERYEENMKDLRKQWTDMSQRKASMSNQILNAKAYADLVVKSNPALFVRIN